MHLNVFMAVNSFAGNPAKLQLILYLCVLVGLQLNASQLLCNLNWCRFPLFVLQQGDSNNTQSSRQAEGTLIQNLSNSNKAV